MKNSILSFAMIFALLIASTALPCTTVFLPQSADKVVGKNMDWPVGQGVIYINKRHVAKSSAFIYAPQTPLKWTSKYMSLTFSQTGREFPWEGMNEAGLSVNIMQMLGSLPPGADVALPAVNGLQWIQFILDTAASVPEAIYNAQHVKISGPAVTTLHFMVCDHNAQCAVFEDLNGNLVIHSGANLPYMALTNNTYDDSVNYLQGKLKNSDPESILNSTSYRSLDRFARAALFSSLFQSDNDDPISYAFNVLWSTHHPGSTQWSMVFSLVPTTVQFKTLQAPQVKGIDLKAFNPSCLAPVRTYNMNSAEGGDVTGHFSDYTYDMNADLVQQSKFNDATKNMLMGYPLTTKCME